MAEIDKILEEPDIPILDARKVHPALKEKLEARQLSNRGDVLPNDPIFAERINFPHGPGGYMALSDSSVLNNGVTPVVRMYTVLRDFNEVTKESLEDAVKKQQAKFPNQEEVTRRANTRAIIEEIASESIRDSIYVIGDHKEPDASNILEPINRNTQVTNLSNAQGYDPNVNTFFKPGVGISRVDLRTIQGQADHGNHLRFTIDLLCENIHDYYDFVEPFFSIPSAQFNLDVSWSNVDLYSVEDMVNLNMGMQDIRDHLYTPQDGSMSYITKNRGDILVLTCNIVTFKATVTKTGGMRVVLDGIAGETRAVTSQPIRPDQTNQQSLENNLENTIWETIQKRIAEQYMDEFDQVENIENPYEERTTAENLRNEFGVLQRSVTFKTISSDEFFIETTDEEGQVNYVPKYEEITDPKTGETIYYDPETGENFIVTLLNETTLEDVWLNILVEEKRKGGNDWANFLNTAFALGSFDVSLPSTDGQEDLSDEFWIDWIKTNIVEKYIPDYRISSTVGGTGAVEVDTNDELRPPLRFLPYTEGEVEKGNNSIARDAWNKAKEEYDSFLKYKSDMGPSLELQAEYAAPPPAIMGDSLYERRILKDKKPLIVNDDLFNQGNRLSLLADYLQQQSNFYKTDITTPNNIASKWGVWLRKLDNDTNLPGPLLDVLAIQQDLSVNDFYVQLGWFEDEVLNTIYGDDTFKSERSYLNRKFNSMDSYLRRFKDYEIYTNDRAKHGDAPYLVYPNQYQRSYNAEQLTVPASYRFENIKNPDRVDPDNNIAVNYEFHTKKMGLVPMREMFINVGKMLESFSDSKLTLGEALDKMMDDISKDSEGFYNIKYATANTQYSYNHFIELNHQPLVPQPKLDGSDDVFYFRPFSPDSLIYDINMGIKYEGEVANFIFAGLVADKATPNGLTSANVESGKSVAELEQLLDVFRNDRGLPKKGTEYFSRNGLSNSSIKNKQHLEQILGFNNSLEEKVSDRRDPLAVGKAFSKQQKMPLSFGQKQNPNKVEYNSAAEEKDLIEDSQDKPIGETKTVDIESPTNQPMSKSARYLRNIKIIDGLTPVFLPYFLELDMWGTGMFKFQDMVSVDYLPNRIKDNYCFILMGIDHKIDEKGWVTSLSATITQRRDKEPPAELQDEKIETKPVELSIEPEIQPTPKPTPQEPKKPVKKKRSSSFLHFDDTGKPVPELEKLRGVSEATAGIHKGSEMDIFFIDQLRTPSGNKFVEDFEWMYRGAVAYSEGIAPLREGSYGFPYFPGHSSFLGKVLQEMGYENGRVYHPTMTKTLKSYFDKQGPADPFNNWFLSNQYEVEVFADKKLKIQPGKRYIDVNLGPRGRVILKHENPIEPFYDYIVPTPEIPPGWDQELYGPWKDDQLKRLWEMTPGVKDVYPTWYDSNRTDRPEPGTPIEDITGYQHLVYEKNAEDRARDFVTFVSKPGAGLVKAVRDIIDFLNDWDGHWSGYEGGRINAAIETKTKEANLQVDGA